MITDSDDPANGIYPGGTPAVPSGPTLQLSGALVNIDAGGLGQLSFTNPRLEGTLSDNGARLESLTGGLLGGVTPAEVLYQVPGALNCPTALHAVVALIGQPDQDLSLIHI